MSSSNKIPLLFLLCTAVVIAAIFSYCELYEEKRSIKQELQEIRKEADQLREELTKINRYSEVYGTTPQVVAVALRESEKYGIKPTVMLELIKLESNFNPKAVSRVGAAGLCQIRPLTARELCRELGVTFEQKKLFNTEFNIRLGAYYLCKLLNSNNWDYHRALTAYNRGPTGLKTYLKTRGTAVSRYSQVISSRSLQSAQI